MEVDNSSEHCSPEWYEFITNLIHFRKIDDDGEQAKDQNIRWIIEQLEESENPPEKPKNSNNEINVYLKQWNNLVFRKNVLWRASYDRNGEEIYQYIVPESKRKQIMEKMHSSPFSGHLMFEKTIDKIRDKYFWPKQQVQVRNFIAACELCQKTTNPKITTRSPIMPIITSRPLELVTMDFMGPLSTSKSGMKHILVIVDHFTKFVTIYATADQKAATLAPKIADFITRFGVPETILTDKGKNFQSNLIEEIYNLLDIRKTKTTPYHPECDGQSERTNRTLKKMIKCFINTSHDDWDEFLPALAFAYNTSIHATTKFSPFFLMFGRKPTLPGDIFIKDPEIIIPITPCEYAEKLRKNLRKAYTAVKQNTTSRMDLAKKHHERKYLAAKFIQGDKVLVKELKTPKGKCKKFTLRWKGPYIVENIFNNLDYILKPLKKRGKKITAHRNNLKKYIDLGLSYEDKNSPEDIKNKKEREESQSESEEELSQEVRKSIKKVKTTQKIKKSLKKIKNKKKIVKNNKKETKITKAAPTRILPERQAKTATLGRKIK